jgi:hypothetical protein
MEHRKVPAMEHRKVPAMEHQKVPAMNGTVIDISTLFQTSCLLQAANAIGPMVYPGPGVNDVPGSQHELTATDDAELAGLRGADRGRSVPAIFLQTMAKLTGGTNLVAWLVTPKLGGNNR